MQHIPDVSVYGMKLRHIIAVLSATGLAACSLPDLPSLPDFPSFSFASEGVEKQPEISCDTARRLNLKALDWAGAKTVDVHILNNRFTPDVLVLRVKAANVIRIFNGDKNLRTFRAQEFFRSSAIAGILYDGRELSENCIDAIRIGALKGAAIQVVPLRQGDFPYVGESSTGFSLNPFSAKAKTGRIIVR